MAIVAYYLYTLAYRGDFADTMQALSGAGLLPDNVGMASQFSEFTYYTNQGFSSYNGLLTTLHKNMGQGLSFDLNYTFSHSIDNVSVIANAPAIGGYGFICDVLRPRNCRGNSDFDTTNYLNGNFVWELPIERAKRLQRMRHSGKRSYRGLVYQRSSKLAHGHSLLCQFDGLCCRLCKQRAWHLDGTHRRPADPQAQMQTALFGLIRRMTLPRSTISRGRSVSRSAGATICVGRNTSISIWALARPSR